MSSAPAADPFDPSSLPIYHSAWHAGVISTADLREHLFWIYTVHGTARQADLALEMFAAAGFVSDSERRIPATITVYRAQVEGEPLGLSWTPRHDRAEFYAGRWAKGWARVGQRVRLDILGGQVRRDDVLMWSRFGCEVVIEPGAVRAFEIVGRPSSRVPAWADVTPAVGVRTVASIAEAQGRLLSHAARSGATDLSRVVRADWLASLNTLMWPEQLR